MRDLLTDLEFQNNLSDPDPIRRAQIQMRTPLPKRFYTQVSVDIHAPGFVVHLDGRPVRTPSKSLLLLPTDAAARLVADEFSAQAETINPTTMPVMRLANTAIDGVSSEAGAVMEDIQRFASSDLLCYRADGPSASSHTSTRRGIRCSIGRVTRLAPASLWRKGSFTWSNPLRPSPPSATI